MASCAFVESKHGRHSYAARLQALPATEHSFSGTRRIAYNSRKFSGPADWPKLAKSPLFLATILRWRHSADGRRRVDEKSALMAVVGQKGRTLDVRELHMVWDDLK